jgi:hypothetical protein
MRSSKRSEMGRCAVLQRAHRRRDTLETLRFTSRSRTPLVSTVRAFVVGSVLYAVRTAYNSERFGDDGEKNVAARDGAGCPVRPRNGALNEAVRQTLDGARVALIGAHVAGRER